jgi:CubicO group peptidase (beta-lactamase class C family)
MIPHNKYLSMFSGGFLILLIFSLGLSASPAAEMPWPTAGWTSSAPEAQGMDSRKLAEAFDYLKAKEPNIHSLLIVRNGVVVTDAYFYPFDSESRHDIASITKSVTSTLVGIAVRKGLIRSVDEHLLHFFPEYKIANLDERKKSITLHHLLAMRSGLQCIVNPTDEVTLMQMVASSDWVQFMLDLPMDAQPGDMFVYNSGAVHLLSAIIRKTTGQNELAFARAELFGPLGISDVKWPFDLHGLDNHGWGDLQLHPRDMAKIGYLFLSDGRWEGRTILTPEWIEAATRPFPGAQREDYGYLWWLDKDYGYSAQGRGDQRIYVLPRMNMVVVITGGRLESPDRLLKEHLLPSVVSPGAPLPPDPQGAALLRVKIEEAGRVPKVTPRAAPAWPEIAPRISGCWIDLEPNSLGLGGLKLDFGTVGEATLTIKQPPAFGSGDIAYRLGFDGVYRKSKGRSGLAAVGIGEWTSPRTLALEIDEVGNINKFRVEMTFDESGMIGNIQEKTGLGRIPIRGVFREAK